MAVQELYPGTQVTIGPNIEDGFYYDFARETPFTPEDLPKIEARMHEIVAHDVPTRREVWPRDEAVAHFEKLGEFYKAELIARFRRTKTSRSTIMATGTTSAAARISHLQRKIGQAFKLTKIAGAYWRGDSNNRAAAADLRHRLARRKGTRRLLYPP